MSAPQRRPSARPGRPSVAMALAVGASLCLAATTGSAWARDRGERTRQIRVTGHAEVTSAPDRVSVSLSVVTHAESAQQAAERNAAETTAVVGRLREVYAEAAELSTSGYTLAPEFEYDKREGRRRPAGFVARNTVNASISDVDAAGRLIDAAIAAGANEVRSVQFGLADPKPLRQQALVAAAADARAKAAALAASMEVGLGRTLRIEEHDTGSAPRPQAMMAMRAEADSTPIEPGDVYVEASVSLWVEIVDR